jgi:predicted membrane protein
MEPTYNRQQEWNQAARLLPALIVIGVGVLFLLNNLHIVLLHNWLDYWPVILIAIGLVKLVDSTDQGGRMIGAVLIGLGGVFLARSLGYLEIRTRDLWPLFLIGAGLLMLWNRIAWPSPWPGGRRPAATANTINENAIFGGGKRHVTTSDFQGGFINAMFGGVELNLRKAGMAGDSATIDINTFSGGVEIKVPETWSVVLQGTAIFGGYSDSTVQPSANTPGVKRLIIRGTAFFGGVDIKN